MKARMSRIDEGIVYLPWGWIRERGANHVPDPAKRCRDG
jgi:hypothetical protein